MLSEARKVVNDEEAREIRIRLLNLAGLFDTSCLLENQGDEAAPSWMLPGEFQCGLGCYRALPAQDHYFEKLEAFRHQLPLFGYLGYDLKNQVEKLVSANPDRIGAPDAFLFEPLHYLRYRDGELYLRSHGDAGKLLQQLLETPAVIPGQVPRLTLEPQFTRDQYIAKVEEVLHNIRIGEVYEMNLCVEHHAEFPGLPPAKVYQRLCEKAHVPFAAWFRHEGLHGLCASPERFLKKEGQQLLSQPIKGTRPRGQTPEEDEALRNELLNSEKDRAENVMIVDLVRNDLARTCRYGSIKVEELFGIYRFSNVHQMISTVSASLRPDKTFAQALKAAFPMGSMTGAPKVRAMQLIEELEESRRGLYSGAIGIIHPNSDFDFNVVIRSIVYREKDGKISVHAGGAITSDSCPEAEWDEIQVKLKAIREVFSG